MAQPAREATIASLVERFLQLGPGRPALAEFLSTVDADVRDEVAARCTDAGFIECFFASLPPLRLLSPLPTEIGGCRIDCLLGEGAMGKVFRARQTALGRDVAIKLVRADPADHSALLERLRDEARVLASLDHPGIVRVLFCGEQDGWLYFAMDLVPGRSLLDTLPKQTPAVPTAAHFDRSTRIVAEALEALAYAHRRGIVHRDLKPSNIVLDRDEHPKLVDFGLARGVASPQRTLPGQLVGTPAYMSPELVGRREHSRFAPDLWAAGVILFQVLTGRLPYEGATTEAVLRMLLRPIAQDPRRFLPAIPKPLAAICMRALAPDPATRYPSAATFAADLRRFLAGEPVDACRSQVGRRVLHHLRRHARLYAVAALVSGSVGATWLAAAAHTERRRLRGEVGRILALGDPRDAAPEVLARQAADARRLASTPGLPCEHLVDLRGLLARLDAEAAARHAAGRALVERGAGSPAGTALAEYRVPAPALFFQGLAQVGEATRVRADLPTVNDVAASTFPALCIGVADNRPAEVRVDAIDVVSGAASATVGRGTAPLRATVPPGTYRVVVSRSDAFAELSTTVHAPGEHRLLAILRPTGDVSAGMIAVPAGTAIVGLATRVATVFAPRRIEHPAFFIDRTEVTCAQFRAFVLATAEPPPASWEPDYDEAWAHLPVVGVTALAAARYAAWAGKRLPTWTEWQVAARGPTGFRFPWGDDAAPLAHAVVGRPKDTPWQLGVRPVGTNRVDVSPCGAVDMLGNVDEWTDSPFVALFEGQPFPVHPWRLCGGVAWNTPLSPPPTLDVLRPGQPEWFWTGFRCAKSVNP